MFPSSRKVTRTQVMRHFTAMTLTYVETVQQTSLFYIESDLDWQLLFVVSRL